jgi:hypothetical protein
VTEGSRAVAALALWATALAGGHAGPLAGTSSRLGAAACLALVAACALLRPAPRAASLRIRLPACALLAAGGTFLAARAPVPEGPVAAAVLVLGLTHVLAGRLAPPSPLEGPALAASGAALLAYETLTARVPRAWIAVEGATRTITEALGRLSGAETSLGPSVAGVPILILALAYVLGRARGRAPWSRALALVAAAWILGLAAAGWALGLPLLLRLFHGLSHLLAPTSSEMPVAGYPAGVGVFLPAVLLACWLVPILLFAAPGRVPASPAPEARPAPWWRAGAAAAGLAAAGAGGGILAAWPALRLPGPEARPRVTFLDKGMLGWEVPGHGQLGLERAGMFGLLPRYLEAAGFAVRRSDAALDPAALEATDVLVVINPTESLPPADRDRLDAFVEAGGGLLVLGDHTDLSGIMGPLNDLLAPYGVAFRFDSAFTPHHWRNDAGFLPGPMTRGLDAANSLFQQSTGASLVLGPGAAPVATARWGFSDAGDRENEENAFLGDYIHQAPEPLGDLPVVAVAPRGRGRAVVLGDTSAFQNVAIPFSWPFLARVFQTAAAREVPVAWALALPGAVLILAALGAAAILGRAGAAASAAAGILAGLALAAPAARSAEPPRALAGARIALVDAAHLNDVSLGLWDKEALGGLNMNLARNGYLPIVDRDGGPDPIGTAAAYVTVAPRRPFTRAEVGALRELAARGGDVLAGVGWEEREPARGLLEMAGLDVAAVPLGPVPVLHKIADDETFRRLQLEPHFAEAWPVSGADPERDEILYASDGFPIVVRRPVGAGRFTLIADTRFLMNGTLEEEGAAWEGNVAFLRRLLGPPAAAEAGE